MATGMLPFDGESSATFERHSARRTGAAVAVESDFRRTESIISKALEKDRNLRYQHASDMRADLQRLKRDTESSAHRRTRNDETRIVSRPGKLRH